ncbi:MAG: DNA polymerase III subunit delta [Candidatus Omnitrophica bacterium]|nr:DNA polymerase III subunit delta [Candidatus Omnitrophota bacterium]
MNYLCRGSEQYLKYQFLEKLKKSLSGKSESHDLDFEVFTATDKEFKKVFLDSFNTLPFISKQKLTVIKDIEKLSSKEEDLILKILKSPKDSTTLVLFSQARESDKALQKISKFTKVIKCDRLKANDINLWIKKDFDTHKKIISPPVINLVREIAGTDLFRLKNEIEKICSFLGNANVVTREHVEMLLGEPSYKTAFQLVDLTLEKKIDKALSFLDTLLTKEKPHQILNLLAWQFRNFLKIKNLPKSASIEEVSRALGISWHFAKSVQEKAGRFTQAALKKNLEIILEADLFMKRGKMDARGSLEYALVSLCK